MTTTTKSLRLPTSSLGLAALVIVYLLLAAFYNQATPLFEAPDAYYHFAVIEHIARTGELPPTENARSHPWRQMAFHAPLYYLISALLIRPIDTSDFPHAYPLNPHAQIGVPSAEHNMNFIAHTGNPLKNTGLAVRIVRGFSTVLGAITLMAVYWLGYGVFQRQAPALLAVLVVLFNPQFLFISSVINNDGLVTALSTLCLALVVHLVRRGITWPGLALLAALLAANALSKASGLALYPVAIVGLCWVCWRDRVSLLRVAAYAAVGVLAFALIAGWWYARNWQRFGDPTASTLVAETTGVRHSEVTTAELTGLYYSFWGVFGWFNIRPPEDEFYYWTALILAAGCLGLVVKLARIRGRFPHDAYVIAGLLALLAAIIVINWCYFNTLVEAGQGRLWFPLLGVVACFVAGGLSSLWPRFVPAILLTPLALAALIFPFALIAPAYTPAAQIPVQSWSPPEGASGVLFREPWQDEACVGLWVKPPVWAGDSSPIALDLAWEAHCPISGFWSVFVHLSDLDAETCITGETGHILSQFDSMPDGGNTPLPAIAPGYVLEDRVHIVPPVHDFTPDLQPYLQVGLYDAGGSFIRAFIVVNDDLLYNADVFPGRCSPELVNVALHHALPPSENVAP